MDGSGRGGTWEAGQSAKGECQRVLTSERRGLKYSAKEGGGSGGRVDREKARDKRGGWEEADLREGKGLSLDGEEVSVKPKRKGWGQRESGGIGNWGEKERGGEPFGKVGEERTERVMMGTRRQSEQQGGGVRG